ncbi:hypothetical protein J6590_072705 [Homalodisca vitripennis]|nr:hypothetical protein J6590_072705 [Homalodisca vitripennis]
MPRVLRRFRSKDPGKEGGVAVVSQVHTSLLRLSTFSCGVRTGAAICSPSLVSYSEPTGPTFHIVELPAVNTYSVL